jgi:L-lactate dehydrogenase (cytochrome)
MPGTFVPSAAEPPSQQELASKDPIPLSMCLCLDDFEAAAERVINRKAFTYFHSAADGLGALRNNQQDWQKVMLRPRILRNVKRVDMRRVMMGQKSFLPFFIAPAARAKLAHEDGELCLARGAARAGIPYCTSTVSTVSHEALAKCLEAERVHQEEGCLFFQLYVANDRKTTVERIETARKHGYKALVITVDSAIVGKREEDERYQAELEYVNGHEVDTTVYVKVAEGEPPVLRAHHTPTLSWDDLKWIRELWGNSGPVALKGIQTVEDALLAAEAGIDAIYLSNHGGRQCDDAPSSIRTLMEIRRFAPELLGKVEIYLDGSVRRGADIVKALCLGATGVAIGRPFMYALGAHGTAGAEKAIKSENDPSIPP